MSEAPDSLLVLESPSRLANRITALLVLFFIAAVIAIGLTLLVSWQLEGSAAAINDAGSQRMRSYRIGLLMVEGVGGKPGIRETLQEELQRFDAVLRDLESGDPVRPMAPPRDADVAAGLSAVRRNWQSTGRPLVERYLNAQDAAGRLAAAELYGDWVTDYVAEINATVLRMERLYTFNANLQRVFQIALVVLAVLATAALIRFFFVLVIRPLDRLYAGIRRMADDDFSVRLPVETRDEFGVVTQGFNRMANHLQKLYATLEERVAAKTSSLESRNLELGVLYEVTAFLSEPASIDDLCEGFTQRLRSATRARAASVRLCSGPDDELFLVAQEGLSAEFVECEQSLSRHQCVCGEALASAGPVVVNLMDKPANLTMSTCIREGLTTTTAFTISNDKRVLGIYNLYFDTPREFSRPEICLLETLGQHLGVAVENRRLRSRERELAAYEERNLLAQELHDSIAQGLAFLNIQVQLLQQSLDRRRPDEVQATVEQIREGIHESYEDVRELLVHCRTRVGQADLDTAIRTALDRLQTQTGIATAFESSGVGIPLPPDDQVQVMHIVQESLSNIRKHAHAGQVRVRVERSPRGTVIAVDDDGVGFDPAQRDESGRHIGLSIMQERALRVGGQCAVQSVPGGGTHVVLTLERRSGNAENPKERV
ncbi:MAG: type IV pili methyl-accepting chemotaxis transducer N-terminal domain-containing protein [Dechloromonas sp.]|nr:type IV pili methyl-accepting chemotaxis transducer N-terminal domain-containing protein [Dechloromonas sp.]